MLNKFRPFWFYFLLFSAYISVFPFIVIYYQNLGFSGAEIGLLTGITPLITFFSAPFWTRLADSTRRHRLIMTLTMGVGILALSLIPLFNAFLPIMAIFILFSFFFAPTTALADNATMHMLGDKRYLYGRVRLGGTVSCALLPPVAGALLQTIGLRSAFWIAGGLYIVALLVSQKFDHGSSKANPPTGAGLRILLEDPHWILFLGVAFVGGMAFNAFNNYLFPYLKELGADESLMGLALSIGTIIEFPVLFFGDRLLRYFKSYGLFLIAIAITGLRLVLSGMATSPYQVLLIQILNGLSFPAVVMAGVSYSYEHAPAGMGATAQGLFSATIFGIGMAAGGLLGGPLMENLGGHGLFLVYGALALAAAIVGMIAEKILPGRKPAAEPVGSQG
jgi:PPP family 3-phenylpropionic acid transporter